MHCITCGQKLECEYETLDEYGKLELYQCYDCDTLYILRDETLSYVKNASDVLGRVWADLELTNNAKNGRLEL